MAKVKVELNHAAVGQLLKSPETGNMLEELAKKYAGGEWKTDQKMMGTRMVASIYSTDYDTVGEELDTHALVGRLG